MKFALLLCLFAAVVVVECYHTFMGTNVLRPMVYHYNAQYSALFLRKRVENLYFSLPVSSQIGRSIQGILAYDMTHSTASANVTLGGIGYNFFNLRMKSERGNDLQYDVYVYT